jgi:hypothetical protein
MEKGLFVNGEENVMQQKLFWFKHKATGNVYLKEIFAPGFFMKNYHLVPWFTPYSRLVSKINSVILVSTCKSYWPSYDRCWWIPPLGSRAEMKIIFCHVPPHMKRLFVHRGWEANSRGFVSTGFCPPPPPHHCQGSSPPVFEAPIMPLG